MKDSRSSFDPSSREFRGYQKEINYDTVKILAENLLFPGLAASERVCFAQASSVKKRILFSALGLESHGAFSSLVKLNPIWIISPPGGMDEPVGLSLPFQKPHPSPVPNVWFNPRLPDDEPRPMGKSSTV
jgi:hypothetical protein